MSLNPPLPDPPRTPVRVRKKIIADKRRRLEKLKREQRRRKLMGEDADSDMDIRELPSMDTLVKSYLRRHEERMKSGVSPSQSRREEEYYNNLLLGRHAANAKDGGGGGGAGKSSASPSSLHTAMGRKSALVENAYAFALRQQQIMIRDDGVMTERDSIERVEDLLREEARSNRQRGRKTAEEVEVWSKAVAADGGRGVHGRKGGEPKSEAGGDNDATTLPSILHDRPRAIRAMNIWSSRLSSVPYARWTIGASTALDHWIAREVLRMTEQAWQRVLEGGGTDAYQVANGKGGDSDTLPGGESRRGLLDRMRDIVVVRGALFPETLVVPGGGVGGADAGAGGSLRGDLDDDLASSGKGGSATEKSIDELLASLGVNDDDDDDGTSWKFDDDDDDDDDGKKKEEDGEGSGDIDDERVASIMDELQVWRGRNASSPYEAWDADRNDEFDVSFQFMVCVSLCLCEGDLQLILTRIVHGISNNLHSNNSPLSRFYYSNGSSRTFPRCTRKPTPVPWTRRPRASLSSRNARSTPRRLRSSGAASGAKRMPNHSWRITARTPSAS